MKEIGERLRDYRKKKKITTVELAAKTGFSQSYLSQLERGKIKPSVGALQKISHVFGVPMAMFFEQEQTEENVRNNVTVVRPEQRKGLIYPKSGVKYQLLTPDLKGKLEVLYITAAPGGETGDEKFEHGGEECGYVLQGTMEVTVGDEKFILYPGDSIAFESTKPHSWKNIGNVELVAFWCVTPPSF